MKPAAVLAGALAALTAVHAAITGATVLWYTLRHPLQDEFRLSHRYLTAPFPGSILATENGHHPVIPGLLRWAQLEWMGGSQALQLTVAWSAAAVLFLVVIRESWKGLRGEPLLRAAALATALTLLSWNATARMFIHAHEAAHVFLAAGGGVFAVWCALRALESTRPAAWWGAALASCTAALLSFGAGAAAFAALVAVAILARRWRAAVVLAALTAVALTLYAVALPGAEAVGRMASTADPGATLYFWMLRLGAIFGEMTRHKEPVAFAASVFALVTALAIARLWLARHAFSRLEILAVALFVFGAATNAAIAITRTRYFFDYREQLFGERFLFWSCLTWAGMGLFLCARLARRGPAARMGAGIAILLLSAAMVPAAKRVHGWAATKYREVELAAMIVRLEARVPSRIVRVVDHAEEEAYALGREMRRHAVEDFRGEPGVRLDEPTYPSALYEIATDLRGFGRGDRFWIVDAEGTVIGAAGPTPGIVEGYVTRTDARARLVQLAAPSRYRAVANLAF